MGKRERAAVVPAKERPYRVPEGEGFFAPHDPVEGSRPANPGPPNGKPE
jgi:hypothetical protein